MYFHKVLEVWLHEYDGIANVLRMVLHGKFGILIVSFFLHIIIIIIIIK